MLLLATTVILTDRLTKIVAVLALGRLPDQATDVIRGVLRFSLLGNSGDVMGGVLQFAPGTNSEVASTLGNVGLRYAAIAAIVAFLAFAYHRWLPTSNRFLMACLGLQLGGGLGNLLDCLAHGQIVDFIGLGVRPKTLEFTASGASCRWS